MTPAVQFLKKHKIPHSLHTYSVDMDGPNYGQAVADALKISHEKLFKTLLVRLNGDSTSLAVCIVPVAHELSLKAAAKAFNAKKAHLADPAIAEKTTGYVVGGISPFGQKKRLPMTLDHSALALPTIFTSGGKRGLQIEFDPADLLSALMINTAVLTE